MTDEEEILDRSIRDLEDDDDKEEDPNNHKQLIKKVKKRAGC